MADSVDVPKGYVRIKMAHRSVITHALIDSGNLYYDLISEDLAKKMNLKIEGRPRKVGTASKGGSVDIMGHVGLVKFYIENIDKVIMIRPYVAKGLAHHVNLGEKFLRREQADLYFRNSSVHMRLPAGTAVLNGSSASLCRRSCDKRIQQVLDKFKDLGSNPGPDNSGILDLRTNSLEDDFPGLYRCDTKSTIVLGDTYKKVYSEENVRLQPGHVSTVSVTIGRADSNGGLQRCKTAGAVILEPDMTAKSEYFVHPGTYQRGQYKLNVLISNFHEDEIELARGQFIGTIHETEEEEPVVNVLDHRPDRELSTQDWKQRIKFIREALALDENEVIGQRAEIKERLIKIFLKNWAAVAVDEFDFGLTSATQFTIEVDKTARPLRQKCRPLNPAQEADLRRQLDEWLTGGIIEPSISEWASALVPVKKKNTNTLRWCIDFRGLNNVTSKDAYPLGSINNNLDKLSGSNIFTTLD